MTVLDSSLMKKQQHGTSGSQTDRLTHTSTKASDSIGSCYNRKGNRSVRRLKQPAPEPVSAEKLPYARQTTHPAQTARMDDHRMNPVNFASVLEIIKEQCQMKGRTGASQKSVGQAYQNIGLINGAIHLVGGKASQARSTKYGKA